MKYYLIAGEASGDLHGSLLIRALRERDPQAQIRAWGGDLMQEAGADLVKHYRELAFMGFVEVALNLRTILGNLRWCKRDIVAFQPEVLVLIDYPGFNMRIAEFARAAGFKVVYYIAPQAWAWKQNRALKLKRDVHRLLSILPFESDFFAGYDLPVDFVGHPLLDALEKRPPVDRQQRLQEWGLDPDQPLLALLPGSRKQEIKTMLPRMLAAAKALGWQVAVAGAPGQEAAFYRDFLQGHRAVLLQAKTYALLEVANLAAVTSGTATLETALFGVPQVVCYRGSWLSYQIARRLVKVKYISLVNLVLDRPFLTELIQSELSAKNLQRELARAYSAESRQEWRYTYRTLRAKLGGPGASAKAAQIVYQTARE